MRCLFSNYGSDLSALQYFTLKTASVLNQVHAQKYRPDKVA